MKRILTLAAILLLVSAFCGCGRFSKPSNDPGGAARTPLPSEGVLVPSRTEAAGETNSVRFEDGKLAGSAFNWNYFSAKAAANLPAELKLITVEAGAEKSMDISFAGGAFTVKTEGGEQSYSHLVKLDSAEGVYWVLTEDGALTAEKFFAGVQPESCIGLITENGVAIFAESN